MKVRTDFVTNSSSSSFILARKSELNDKQKEAIIQFVENSMLGKKILGPESTDDEIQKVFEDEWEYYDEGTKEEIRRALKEGKTIYSDEVCFDYDSYSYADVLRIIWELMEKNGDGNFDTIDGDLSY